MKVFFALLAAAIPETARVDSMTSQRCIRDGHRGLLRLSLGEAAEASPRLCWSDDPAGTRLLQPPQAVLLLKAGHNSVRYAAYCFLSLCEPHLP